MPVRNASTTSPSSSILSSCPCEREEPWGWDVLFVVRGSADRTPFFGQLDQFQGGVTSTRHFGCGVARQYFTVGLQDVC